MKEKTVLERFKKGFPDRDWKLYFDRKLGKETIMRSDCENVNELLGYTHRLRYDKNYQPI